MAVHEFGDRVKGRLFNDCADAEAAFEEVSKSSDLATALLGPSGELLMQYGRYGPQEHRDWAILRRRVQTLLCVIPHQGTSRRQNVQPPDFWRIRESPH